MFARALTILRSRRIHFAIRAVGSAQHGPMVPFVHFLLLARIEVIHSDPGVIGGSNDESVSEKGVERSGCRGVREGDSHGRVLSVLRQQRFQTMIVV